MSSGQHDNLSKHVYKGNDTQLCSRTVLKISHTFTESKHGKRRLCYFDYRYSSKRKNENDSEYWVCVKCKATATSYSDLSVVEHDDHTHLSDETDKEVLEMRTNLKGKIIEASGLVDRIVEEAFHAICIKKDRKKISKVL